MNSKPHPPLSKGKPIPKQPPRTIRKSSDKRYQHQPWYIKLWRRRWYLTIPYRAVRIYFRTSRDKMSWRSCWSVSKGLAQDPMEWWYTMDEVNAHIRDKFDC